MYDPMKYDPVIGKNSELSDEECAAIFDAAIAEAGKLLDSTTLNELRDGRTARLLAKRLGIPVTTAEAAIDVARGRS